MQQSMMGRRGRGGTLVVNSSTVLGWEARIYKVTRRVVCDRGGWGGWCR